MVSLTLCLNSELLLSLVYDLTPTFFHNSTFESVSVVYRWSVIRGLKRKNDPTQEDKVNSEDLPVIFVATDILSWLPAALKDDATDENKSGRILLFYKYRYHNCLAILLRFPWKVNIFVNKNAFQ